MSTGSESSRPGFPDAEWWGYFDGVKSGSRTIDGSKRFFLAQYAVAPLAERLLAVPVELAIEPVVFLNDAKRIRRQHLSRGAVSTHILPHVEWVTPAE